MDACFGLYAYAVVGENIEKLNILGIDKKNKVFPLERDGLFVFVSKIDTGRFKNQVEEVLSEMTKSQNSLPDKVENLLLSHQEVVDAMAKVVTVVPFKFGTVLKNETAALKMLKDYEKKFKTLLFRFIGREEWGVKAYVDTKKFKNYLVKTDPDFKKTSSGFSKVSPGMRYLLGKKLEEEAEEKLAYRLNEIVEAVFHQLERLTFEAQVNKTLSKKLTGKEKEMVLNSAYLIEKKRVVNFQKQLARLIEKYQPAGFEFEVSGPWPAYSFT